MSQRKHCPLGRHKKALLNAPSTYAITSSFPHYPDQGIVVWRACSKAQATQECPKLNQNVSLQLSASILISLCPMSSGICEKALTPVDNPHFDCRIIWKVGLELWYWENWLCRALLWVIWPRFKIGESRAVLDSGDANVLPQANSLALFDCLLFLPNFISWSPVCAITFATC